LCRHPTLVTEGAIPLPGRDEQPAASSSWHEFRERGGIMSVLIKFSLAILILLGVAMIIIGVMDSLLPPALTGIGFLVVSLIIYQMHRLPSP
jgi:hypothetical protein